MDCAAILYLGEPESPNASLSTRREIGRAAETRRRASEVRRESQKRPDELLSRMGNCPGLLTTFRKFETTCAWVPERNAPQTLSASDTVAPLLNSVAHYSCEGEIRD